MPGDHQARFGVEQRRDIGDVMHQQGLDAVKRQQQVIGDVAGPGCLLVVVAPYHLHGGEGRQRCEDIGLADVARVQDEVAAVERRQRFWTEQAVGVRNKAEAHERSPVVVDRP